jgi:L-lactate dehydrogenase complex protein LldG
MNEQLIETFLSNWERWGGDWERWDNPIAARLALLRYLNEQHRTEILSWQVDALPIPALADALNDAKFTLFPPHRRNLNPDLSIGLTSADAALAASGSLVMTPASGRSWLPALIPIHHVALLPVSRLYTDLDAWRRAWRASRPGDAARSLIISGPSISDDIEQHPHRGMFGPRQIHLILFHDGISA